MSFSVTAQNELTAEASRKYGALSAGFYTTFLGADGYFMNMKGIADGMGAGHNGVNLTMAYEMLNDMEVFDHPAESYGFVRFSNDWDRDRDERMGFDQFKLYLQDVCAVFAAQVPEQATQAQTACAQALQTVEKIEAAHVLWRKNNPGSLV